MATPRVGRVTMVERNCAWAEDTHPGFSKAFEAGPGYRVAVAIECGSRLLARAVRMLSAHGEGIVWKFTEGMGAPPAGITPNRLRSRKPVTNRVGKNVVPVVTSAIDYKEKACIMAEKTGIDLKGKTVEAACQLARPVSKAALTGMHDGHCSPPVVQASLVAIATMEAFWQWKKTVSETEKRLVVCGGVFAVHLIRHRCIGVSFSSFSTY